MPHPSPWTQERDEQLRKLYAEGLSASLIAREIGDTTRNAVIGRLHRLKLKSGAKPTKTLNGEKTRILPVKRTTEAGRNMKTKTVIPLKERRGKPVKRSKPCALLDVTGCRYALGGPYERAVLFCNAPLLDKKGNALAGCSKSYCADHTALCYSTPSQRARVSPLPEASGKAILKIGTNWA